LKPITDPSSNKYIGKTLSGNSVNNSIGGIGSMKGTIAQLLLPNESLNQRQSNSMVARSIVKSKQQKLKQLTKQNKERIESLQKKHNIIQH